MKEKITGMYFSIIIVLSVIFLGTEVPAATINVPTDYSTIQGAIDVANSGDEVLVDNGTGTYYENIDFKGKAITVHSKNGAGAVTINGGASGSVVSFKTSEGASSVLDGFTLINGSGTYNAIFAANVGGGIFCKSSSPTITNCIISGNTAFAGGGIFCDSFSPTITNCTISGNTASFAGGMYCRNSSPTMTNCIISGNTANNATGGIYCYSPSTSTYPTMTNCIISGNTAKAGDGGGIECDSSSPTITNCTFSGNTANDGGGIKCYSSSPIVKNSILWGDSVGEISLDNLSSITVTYSDVDQDGYGNPDGSADG